MSERNAFSRLVLALVYSNNELKTASLDFVSKMSKRSLASMLTSDEYHEFKTKNEAMSKEVSSMIYQQLE